MMSEPFDPADANVWISRGREPEHAAIIAKAWQDFPDLANDAPLEQRMARTRARVDAMRPVMEAIGIAQERKRQATNFAFTERRVANGEGDERDTAILRARDRHGYDWDEAVHYAYGLYAGHAGWDASPPRDRSDRDLGGAYMTGFRDAGGDPDDIFDAARRSLVARERKRDRPQPGIEPKLARPLPSDWPLPSDAPRPSLWARRLLLLGAPEAGLSGETGTSAFLSDMLRTYPGAETMTLIIVTLDGFVPASQVASGGSPRQNAAPLRTLVQDQEFDDILIAAQGPLLALVDAHARYLPLARNMERTRNSPLQQKTHLRTWLDRGISPGQTVGAGHIRWGKVAKGLSAKLGELTVRYDGKHPQLGHRIIVELAGGKPAIGFVTTSGEKLSPETYVSNRKHLRPAMTSCLRQFGGATRLVSSTSGLFDNLSPVSA